MGGRVKATVWICAVFSTAGMLAGDRITVSVCTLGHLSSKAVARAETGTAALFRSMDVDVVWGKCEGAPVGEEAAQQHWFTLRMRAGSPFGIPESASLDTLGQAFLSESRAGYLAEVYYETTQSLASREQLEPEDLLASVMAHELGHLLLGPGHAPDGVMRAAWDGRDLESIRMGRLKFSRVEAVRIHQALQDSANAAATD